MFLDIFINKSVVFSLDLFDLGNTLLEKPILRFMGTISQKFIFKHFCGFYGPKTQIPNVMGPINLNVCLKFIRPNEKIYIYKNVKKYLKKTHF